MCTEKVKGTNWLCQKAGTKQNMAACGKNYNAFCKSWGRNKEGESDEETEMKLIKGFAEVMCLPI